MSIGTAAFDGDDLRRKTVLSGVTTTFVWDGPDYLQARRSSGGDSLFVVLRGEVVAEVRDGTLRDFLTDPLGSVVAHLDSSQNLIAEFEYWPYGELVGTAETTDLPFLWVGALGYHTDSTLTTYIRRRAYRQDLGSWLQLDPLWPDEGAYAYASRSPIVLTDSTGLRPKRCQDYLSGSRPPDSDEVEDAIRGCVDSCLGKKKYGTCLVRCLVTKNLRRLTLQERQLACCLMASGSNRNRVGWDPCDSTGRFFDAKSCCNYHFCLCSLDVARHHSEIRECRFDLIYELCAQDASNACSNPNYTGPYGEATW